jgi:trehalose-6-phosphate synthase
MAIIQMPQRASAFWSEASSADWDEEGLRAMVASRLTSDQVIVVSDRQPFSHERLNGQLVVKQPASGLITAVEPIVRACGGTWVAHGSGSADREAVDDNDVWLSPVAGGSYRLRRLWMTDAETRAYRDGFSNSGLWPLCHMVHVRPAFVERDWQQYQKVNRRFADAIVEEANQPDPVILVHDYHLALVPAMVRERLPRATIVSFWHIPWTSPEQMSICPWLPALVEGLLGSDIVGFQTDQHRKNFVASAELCGKDMSRSLRRGGSGRAHKTLVRDYPISVAWPVKSKAAKFVPCAALNTAALNRSAVPDHEKLIVGIDRFDYTKGLVERLHAVEHLLASRPEWCGRLKFVQVAAPSRTSLPDYVAFRSQVFEEVGRINQKFATSTWKPLELLDSHHDHAAVQALYQAADVCLVTSLHDGMNLVCKEFVVARDDEQGVLVLSEFAGASHELTSALIVNPYHTAQVADALHKGLVMPAAEQRERMQSLRATVKKHNVYRWAAHMLLDAVDLRDSRVAERPLQASNGLLATA